MTIYKWKTGCRPMADAQIAGTVCAELDSTGGLTPKRLVDASRRKDAPLHGAFEWDDSVAAEKFRESQASYIIRSLEIEIKGAPTTRAFASVQLDTEKCVYVPTTQAMENVDMRDYVLSTAKRELAAFRKKYANLTELANIFDAIDEFTARDEVA